MEQKSIALQFTPRPRSRVELAVLSILGLTAVPFAALAAPADDSSVQLEEIIVTAQFRPEAVQTTPIAITAITGDQLTERGIAGVTHLGDVVPNLLTTRPMGAQGQGAGFSLRGVGQVDGHPGFQQGVALYVNDQYYGQSLGSRWSFFDVDRVEVLRGPQGTLSGKNAIGGAVKVFSRVPNDVNNGYISVNAGNFDHVGLTAASNFTLVPDHFYARAAIMSTRTQGFMKRVDYQCANPGSNVPTQVAITGNGDCVLGHQGGDDVQAARLTLRYTSGANFTNTLYADVLRDRSQVAATKLLRINNAMVPNGSQFVAGPKDYITYETYVNLGFTDPARYLTPTPQPGAGTHGAFAMPETNPQDGYGFNNTLQWTFGDNYSFDSISTYRHEQGRYSIALDASPYTIQDLYNSFSQEQYTQEFRVSGRMGNHIDWTTGLYYYKQRAFFGGYKSLSPGLASETLFVGNDPIPAESRSAFVHVIWNLTSQIDLITGVRFTDEDKDYTFTRKNPFVQSLPSYTPVGVIDGSTGSYSGSRMDYRAGLEYKITETNMLYTQGSTGFRGGGINPRPFIVQQEVPFGPETMKSIELGSKNYLFDRLVRFNPDVFYSWYHNILFNNTAPTLDAVGNVLSANNATPTNAGDAKIYGAEVEMTARVGGGLLLNANFSWLHFEFTKISAPGATIPGVTLDTREPYAPSRKGSIGLQYEFNLGSYGRVLPRADVNYQSDFYTDIGNNPETRVAARTLVNAGITWQSYDDDWEVTLAGTNVTNRFYYDNRARAAPPTDVLTGQPGAPRMWTLGAKHNF
jgi:iron complex outermembrane receptor protein